MLLVSPKDPKNPSNLKLLMGEEGRKRFLKNYWIKVTNKKLLKVYREIFRNP